jgi:hypothetical protein
MAEQPGPLPVRTARIGAEPAALVSIQRDPELLRRVLEGLLALDVGVARAR